MLCHCLVSLDCPFYLEFSYSSHSHKGHSHKGLLLVIHNFDMSLIGGLPWPCTFRALSVLLYTSTALMGLVKLSVIEFAKSSTSHKQCSTSLRTFQPSVLFINNYGQHWWGSYRFAWLLRKVVLKVFAIFLIKKSGDYEVCLFF